MNLYTPPYTRGQIPQFGFCNSSILLREGWRLQNGWIFGKVPKGGGVISNPKIYVADFGHLNRAFWAWNWYKRVISGYVFQQLYWEKSKQDTFWRGPPPHPLWNFSKNSSVLEMSSFPDCHHSRGQDQDQCMYHVHVLHTIWPSYRLA